MEYWENDSSPLLKFYHRHWPAFLLVLLGLLLCSFPPTDSF